MCFFDGADRIELGDSADFYLRGSAGDRGFDALAVKMDLHETWQVERFVRQHLQGASELQRARALLSGQLAHNHRLTDQEVLRHIANRLQSGQLCAYVHKHVPPTARAQGAETQAWSSDTGMTAWSAAPQPSVAPIKATPVRPRPESVRQETSPAEKPQPPVDPAPIVTPVKSAQQQRIEAIQDAQAATLETAARDGTPFCAICELKKAEAARQKTASPAPDAAPTERQAAQDAQAATLETAAKDGTPFCAICELKKAEAARQKAASPAHDNPPDRP
ncbi:hypothetical protein [Pseudomonas sp. 3A(2025)]